MIHHNSLVTLVCELQKEKWLILMCVAVFQKQWEIKFTDRSSRAAGQINLLQHQIKCLRFGALWLRSVVKHKYMWVYQQIIALTRLLKIVCNANVKAPTIVMWEDLSLHDHDQ